jgi:hypothetical protein
VEIGAVRKLDPALTGGAQGKLKRGAAFAPQPGRKAGDMNVMTRYGWITGWFRRARHWGKIGDGEGLSFTIRVAFAQERNYEDWFCPA